MRIIIVKKIAKYDLLIQGMSKYDSYDLVARQKYSPGITKKSKHDKVVYDRIFSSDLKRGIESSIQYLSKESTMFLADLREVKFSLRSLLSESEYDAHGSNLVRERFIRGFERDDLIEPRKEIERRLLLVIKRLKELPSGVYLVVSHSFFMKILDVYVNRGDLFKVTSLLRKYFNTTKKTYNSGGGFNFEL